MTSLLCLAVNSRYFVAGKWTRACQVSTRSIFHLSHRDGQRPTVSTSIFDPKKYPVSLTTRVTVPWVQITRPTSFFNKVPAEQLWKGVTSVSNAGKKRGRGKGVGKKMAKNLNRGQVIGLGSENIQWPGLSAPILRGKELVQQQKLPKDEEREAKLLKLRDSMGVFRPLRIDPLERGWSGTKMPGRSIGPPDPIGEDMFEGFDTKVLEFKTVTHMSGIFGRKKQMSLFVVTGNGNGLGGFALARSTTVPGVIKKAKNRASQKLIYFERYNGHTLMHDFFSHFGATKIFAKKMPEGYGLVCHRAIRTICEVIGIKDIHVKVEGSTKHIQNLTKAFFLGLLNQKTYQEIADDKQLHLVEFREENLNFPKVVASPQTDVRTFTQIPKDEELNFDLYIMGGKMELKKKKYPPFYTRLYGWEIHKKKYAKYRNQEKVREQLILEYGDIRSFYADQYPECKGGFVKKEVEE